MRLPATAAALLPALLVPRATPHMALTTGAGVRLVKLVVDDQLSNEASMASEEEMVFDELPAPLERVLLSEQGSAVGRGWASAVEQDACALLGAAGLDDGEQLSLMLCDDETIRELNSRWREVDAPTDVLSFPMDDPQLLGDLVISLDTAERQAKERQFATRDELRVSKPLRCSHALHTRLPAPPRLVCPHPRGEACRRARRSSWSTACCTSLATITRTTPRLTRRWQLQRASCSRVWAGPGAA